MVDALKCAGAIVGDFVIVAFLVLCQAGLCSVKQLVLAAKVPSSAREIVAVIPMSLDPKAVKGVAPDINAVLAIGGLLHKPLLR